MANLSRVSRLRSRRCVSSCLVTKPRNLLLWLGSRFARRQKTSEVASVGAGLLGSGVVSSAPAVGGPLIVVAVVIFASLLRWRSESDSLDETLSARELLLEEWLSPFLEELATNVPRSMELRRETASKLTDRACAQLAGAFATIIGVRVCVFRVSDDAQTMTCAAKGGRNQRPHEFVRGTNRGDKAFALFDDPFPYIFAPDLDSEDVADEWAGSGDGYRTFITAPIRSTDSGFGLLTIDAQKAGDLDHRHGRTIALYAAALAVAYAEEALPE